MAVNLDKEAYYRRIKRLYSNWKVKMSRFKLLLRLQRGESERPARS